MTKRPHLAQRPAGSLRLRVARGAAPAWDCSLVLRACAPSLLIRPWCAVGRACAFALTGCAASQCVVAGRKA